MAGVRKVFFGNFPNIIQSLRKSVAPGSRQTLQRHNTELPTRWTLQCRCKSASSNAASPINQLSASASTSSSASTHRFSTSPSPRYVEDTEDDISTEVMERVGTQLQTGDIGRLFAVVHVGGHQRKVTTEDILVLTKPIVADIGERIRLNKVMLVGSSDFTLIGRPVLSPDVVNVEATVIEKTLSHTKVWFMYRRRKNWKRMKLLQDQYTLLRINKIELLQLKDQ